MNDILKAREWRFLLIKEMVASSHHPVALVKANIPGSDKNKSLAYLVVNLFHKYLLDNYQISREQFYESSDGPFYLVEIVKLAKTLKMELIMVEDKHPLGRLVDFDVYEKIGNISRTHLKQEPRKCLICNLPAHQCIRSKAHQLIEIESKIDEIAISYLKDEIKKIIDEAMTLEAMLDPKFGLVTYYSCGSHSDMNYHLMEKSKEVILDNFVLMFEAGYLFPFDVAFRKARVIGVKSEELMFQTTKGINTYKGLIFVLGFVLVALGYCLKNNQQDLFHQIKYLGRNLLDEFQTNDFNSFGLQAYSRYQFTGIRGEVHRGLPNVQKVLPLITDYQESTLTLALIELIRNAEDTVLLKRAGNLEQYHYFRQLVGSIQEYDLEKINQITKECIKHNISFGGAADLLVVAIFIRKVEEKFAIKYE